MRLIIDCKTVGYSVNIQEGRMIVPKKSIKFTQPALASVEKSGSTNSGSFLNHVKYTMIPKHSAKKQVFSMA